MSEITTKIASKRNRLKATFCAQIPDRISHGRRLLEGLTAPDEKNDNDAMVNLHRLFHNLKGTARTLGFTDLGDLAAQAETYCVHLLDADPAPNPSEVAATVKIWLDDLLHCACDPEQVGVDLQKTQPPADESITMPSGGASTSDGRLVFLCDTNGEELSQLDYQLSCFGYHVKSFRDADSFDKAVALTPPNAVVMDVNFPANRLIGGLAHAGSARKPNLNIPLVFLSCHQEFEIRLQAVRAGGEACLQKPIKVLELLSALDRLTGQRRPEPYRVLVVDDDADVARYHCLILQEAGMQTRHLAEPAHTLRVLQEFHPDMLLIDMYMPICSGSELAAVIRQLPEYVGMPIVYLSSETDREKQFSAMRVGADGFMTKPVLAQDLIAAVTIRAERMRTLRALMARDSLTGLYNHSTTTDLLHKALLTAEREATSVCMVMIDIDRFKTVNDTYGHPTGDQVIIALARMLLQRLRATDIIGRYGGEEFAVIIHKIPLVSAGRIIDALRANFARFVFSADHESFTCTFSAGIAAYPAYQTVEMLREAADKALYEAKNSGRNRVALDEGGK